MTKETEEWPNVGLYCQSLSLAMTRGGKTDIRALVLKRFNPYKHVVLFLGHM